MNERCFTIIVAIIISWFSDEENYRLIYMIRFRVRVTNSPVCHSVLLFLSISRFFTIGPSEYFFAKIRNATNLLNG